MTLLLGSRNFNEGSFQERNVHWNRKRMLNRSRRKKVKMLCRGTWQNPNRVQRVYAELDRS